MPPKRKAAAKSKVTAKEPESTEEEGPKPRRGRARSRGDSTAEAEAEPESKKARTRSSSSEVAEDNGENSDADKQAAEKSEPVAEENGKDDAVEAKEETAPEEEEPEPEPEPEVTQGPPQEKVESAPEVALEPQQVEPVAAMPAPVENQPQQQASRELAADPTNPAPGGLHDQFYMLLSPDGLSAVIDVHPRKCGAVIGSRGAVIHGMQERSGARIKLNQDYPDGEMRKLTISGSQEQVQMCAELVKRVLEPGGGSHSIHENALSGGDVMTEIVMCPPPLVGRVVGRGGGNVREVQTRSGARVQVNQQFPEGQDRQVEITGTQAAVRAAVELVKFIMENGPVLPAPGMPLTAGAAAGGGAGGGAYGPGVSAGGGGAGGVALAPGTAAVTVECPKACIGRVIGRGGDTVSRIQRETQAKVHIDQNVPEGAPVKVNISGYEAAVHAAIKLVQDIMVNGSAGFGGGGGIGGGYGQQQQMGGYGVGGGGGYGQQPQQQMGGYGSGGHGGGGGGYGGQGGSRGGGGGYGGHAGSTYGPGGGGGGQQQYAAQHTGGYGGGGAPPPRGGPPGGGLPHGWVEYKDQGGTPYFHNAASGVTQWERP